MTLKDSKLVKTLLVLVAVAAAAAAVGVAVSAQMGPGPVVPQGHGRMGMGGPGMMGGPRGGEFGGRMGMMGFGLGSLDLTDEQRTQVRGIMQAHQKDFKAVGEKMTAARKALHEAVIAEAFNETTIRDKAAAVAALDADIAVLQATVRARVFEVLTPEQKLKAKELRDTRQKRMEERRKRMEQRIEGRSGQKRGGPEAV